MVAIKNIDLPKSCYECPCFYETEGAFFDGCQVMQSDFVGVDFERGRPDWCPLVDIPTPHGRLIDADQMLADESEAFMSAQLKLTDEWTKLTNEVIHKKLQMLLADTPTVIEAEGQEDTNDRT